MFEAPPLTPVGAITVRLTAPVNPALPVTVATNAAVAPWFTVTEVGARESAIEPGCVALSHPNAAAVHRIAKPQRTRYAGLIGVTPPSVARSGMGIPLWRLGSVFVSRTGTASVPGGASNCAAALVQQRLELSVPQIERVARSHYSNAQRAQRKLPPLRHFISVVESHTPTIDERHTAPANDG